MYYQYIKSGEESGTLAQTLKNVSDTINRKSRDMATVIGLIAYPALVLVLSIILILGLLLFIFPKLEPLISTSKNIPFYTKFFMVMSDYLRNNTALFTSIILLTIATVVHVLISRRTISFREKLGLKIPFIKEIITGSRMKSLCEVLVLSLKSKQSFVSCEEVAKRDSCPEKFKTELLYFYNHISRGGEMIRAPKGYYIDEIWIRVISVGLSTGRLEHYIVMLGEIYTQRMVRSLKLLMGSITPICLCGLGALIAIVAISIITPIYDVLHATGR
jgi:type II secretory pathway component PulF